MAIEALESQDRQAIIAGSYLLEGEDNVPDTNVGDIISRQAAIDALDGEITVTGRENAEAVRGYVRLVADRLKRLPSAQLEDYTELKREFLRLASYIDVLLECSDEQKETLMGFISRLAEFMPWTERD